MYLGVGRTVTVSFGEPLPPAATAHDVRTRVAELAAEAFDHRRGAQVLLHHAFIRAAKKTWGRTCIADSTGAKMSYGRLLIAATLADAPTELVVRNPGEKPWVGVTLHWLDRCGVEYSNENFERFRVRGRSLWDAFDVQIPLDWSAALYPIVAAVLTPDSEVRAGGMDFGDPQGDKEVINVLREMGADIQIADGEVIARSSSLAGREIDCNDFVDQFTLLAVVGTQAQGETVLTKAEVCRHKECDRIAAICGALKAMGADVEERPDGLAVRNSALRGARLDSRADHRLVMTLAVAGLLAEGDTTITSAECVKKTFPDFVAQMQGLGCDMQAR